MIFCQLYRGWSCAFSDIFEFTHLLVSKMSEKALYQPLQSKKSTRKELFHAEIPLC